MYKHEKTYRVVYMNMVRIWSRGTCSAAPFLVSSLNPYKYARLFAIRKIPNHHFSVEIHNILVVI